MHSNFLDEYMSAGYSEIVVIDSNATEDSGFHATERERETAIAKKENAFYSLFAYRRTDFGPNGKRELSIDSKQISADEYSAQAKDKVRADTSEERARFLKLQADTDQAALIQAELDKSVPACPNCEKKMRRKHGPKVAFWGCPSYPKCKGQRWLTPAQKALSDQLDKLPTR